MEAPLPSLPEFRVGDALTFTNIGVDLTCPLFYREQNGDLKKCYIAIYTFCKSRALNLDLVKDLSVTVFLRSRA